MEGVSIAFDVEVETVISPFAECTSYEASPVEVTYPKAEILVFRVVVESPMVVFPAEVDEDRMPDTVRSWVGVVSPFMESNAAVIYPGFTKFITPFEATLMFVPDVYWRRFRKILHDDVV